MGNAEEVHAGEYKITWKAVYWDKAIMLMMGTKMA